VGGIQRQRGADIFQCLLQRLPRQAEHQIQVEIVETGCLCHFGGADGFLAAVDASQRLQVPVVEALRADGQAVDTGLAEASELAAFRRAGIGFEGDFRLRGQGQPRGDAFQQGGDGFGAEQAGCAAADEHGLHGAPRGLWQILVEVGQQRLDIGLLGQGAFRRVGVEIAIRAFADAPGNVDVQA